MNLRKRGIALILTIALFITGSIVPSNQEVQAATKYIKLGDFITNVVKQVGLKVNGKESESYINAAIDAGIIKENEYKSYSKYTTRTDVSVILVRADEYLNGITISNDKVDLIIDKRISDINSVSKDKREYVAKCYALGFIKGYSNGAYSTDRQFRGSKKITTKGALEVIKLLTNKKNRAKISPDGQLIRTTKLPSNADMYPYILASYPNAYYDWEFGFMKWTSDGLPIYGTDKLVNLKDYAAPVDLKKLDLLNWEKSENKDIEEIYNENIDSWVSKARKYVETVFKVDYRTLKDDKEWFETIIQLDGQYGWNNQKNTESRLKQYIDAAIKNKTIVESKIVAIDGSTLYHDKGLYLRVYVKYRFISAIDTSQVKLSPLVFSNRNYSNYDNVVLGEWRDGYFDIGLTVNGNGDLSPENWGIGNFILSDYRHNNKVVGN